MFNIHNFYSAYIQEITIFKLWWKRAQHSWHSSHASLFTSYPLNLWGIFEQINWTSTKSEEKKGSALSTTNKTQLKNCLQYSTI